MRSHWKGPYVEKSLLAKIPKRNLLSIKAIKTISRKSKVVPMLVGQVFRIYNGKTYSIVRIVDEMVGCKLGEFSPTRKKFTFKKKKNK